MLPVALTTGILACSAPLDSVTPPIDSPVSVAALVTIAPTALALAAGDTGRLVAVVQDEAQHELPGTSLSWTTSDSSVALVSADGLVTARALGTATIRAAAGTKESHVSVQVEASGSPGTPTPGTPTPVAAECASRKAAWIWCDDFEQDRLSSYFEYVAANGSFVRTTGVGRNGSYGMRGRFAPGQIAAGNLKLAFGRTPSATFRPVDAGTKNYREIYWRLYLRNQPGWVAGGANSKLSRATVFAGSNWSQAAIGHVWSTGASNTLLGVDPASGTDAAGNVVTTTYNDFPKLRWLGIARGTTPVFDPAHVGQWYCIEAHMRLNDAGQSNGFIEFWINDKLEARHSGLNWLGNYSAYGINTVMFENYWNSGSPVAQERYFDNIVVSTERIGC
jgi:hypothetical protein